LVPAGKGETGVLIGVAPALDEVLKGNDILIRKNEPRRDPSKSGHVTRRNATILAAQALHMSDWIFSPAPTGKTQPEMEGFGPLDALSPLNLEEPGFYSEPESAFEHDTEDEAADEMEGSYA
jgi:hypothetical protein